MNTNEEPYKSPSEQITADVETVVAAPSGAHMQMEIKLPHDTTFHLFQLKSVLAAFDQKSTTADAVRAGIIAALRKNQSPHGLMRAASALRVVFLGDRVAESLDDWKLPRAGTPEDDISNDRADAIHVAIAGVIEQLGRLVAFDVLAPVVDAFMRSSRLNPQPEAAEKPESSS